jgi:hypothetical protein
MVMLELNLKGQCVVETTSLLFQSVLVICDISPLTLPMLITHRVQQGFHALII